MELIGVLALLALTDSTSIGTLVIPVWMLLRNKPNSKRILTYLLTISLFYLAVGIVLLAVFTQITGAMASAAQNPAFLWGQLALGVGIFASTFIMDHKGTVPKRYAVWKERLNSGDESPAVVIKLALVAGTVELISMVPYLAAVGLLVKSGWAFGAQVLVLAGYVALMAVPAVILLGLRLVAGRKGAPFLNKVDGWLDKNANEVTQTVLTLVAIVLVGDAVQRLHLFGM